MYHGIDVFGPCLCFDLWYQLWQSLMGSSTDSSLGPFQSALQQIYFGEWILGQLPPKETNSLWSSLVSVNVGLT